MQDMRFNTPMPPATLKAPEALNQAKTKGFSVSKILVIFLVVIVVAGAVIGFNYYRSRTVVQDASASDYYAVFLDNSQVYFGKMIAKSKNEMTLSQVYYLQASDNGNTELNNQRFTLIKLGQELHGPTDQMIINVEHVIFYAKLRAASKVVESIKNQN